MIVNVSVSPVQLAVFGVTVIVPDIAELVAFIPVNDDIFPVPDAPKPIAVLLFVQS